MNPPAHEKHGDAAALALECLKTEAAHRVAVQTGAFHVPAVLSSQGGRIETEFVPDLVILAEMIDRDDARTADVFSELGRALGLVHEHMVLPATARTPLPDEWLGECEEERAFLHGDLTSRNVGWSRSLGKVVLFDWSGAPALCPGCTYGSVYFDLALLLAHSAYGTSVRRPWPRGREAWFDGFVGAYAAERPGVLGAREMNAALDRMDRVYESETGRRAAGIAAPLRPAFKIAAERRHRAWRRYRADGALGDPKDRERGPHR